MASGFDVAHDNGLRTGMYANKSKFMLFDTYNSYTGGGSYNATYGALDVTGADNGRDKIDNTYINTALGGIVVNTFTNQQQSASSNHLVLVHINDPDAYGHSSGWGSVAWNNSVVAVDTMLGNIFKMIEQDAPAMIGKTAIILTADHANQDNPPTGADRYAVPFYVWGPGVPAGADLYALNADRRQVASSYPMTHLCWHAAHPECGGQQPRAGSVGPGGDPRFNDQQRPGPRGHRHADHCHCHRQQRPVQGLWRGGADAHLYLLGSGRHLHRRLGPRVRRERRQLCHQPGQPVRRG